MSALLPGALSAGLVVATLAACGQAHRASSVAALGRRLSPNAASTSYQWCPPHPAWIAPRLRAAGVEWSPALVWQVWVVGTVAAGALGVAVGGPMVAALALLAALVSPVVAVAVTQGRGDRLIEGALPTALEAVAAGLRSGASLTQAVTDARQAVPEPLASDLALLHAAVGHGVPLATALEEWAGHRSLPGVRLAVAALGLGASTGGAHAQAVDGVAATVRARLALQAEVRALASQARASALVIALAPVGFCFLAVSTDAGTADFLFHTPLGAACLAGGLALDAVAAVWMSRLTRVDQ